MNQTHKAETTQNTDFYQHELQQRLRELKDLMTKSDRDYVEVIIFKIIEKKIQTKLLTNFGGKLLKKSMRQNFFIEL